MWRGTWLFSAEDKLFNKVVFESQHFYQSHLEGTVDDLLVLGDLCALPSLTIIEHGFNHNVTNLLDSID